MRVATAVLTAWISVACSGGPAPSGRDVSIVVTNGTVVTMNAAGEVIDDGAVAVDGATIVAVGRRASIDAEFRGRETIDAAGGVIMPGLINTHTHAPMVLYRGLADDLALEEWLNGYIFPAEAKTVSPEFVRAGTRLAALEMIQSGTTTFADMYYFERDIADVVKAAGLRAVLGQTVIRFPVADAATPEAGLARAEAFIAEFKADPLITPAVAPHAVSTLEPATLKAARDLSKAHGVPTLIHLSETRAEVADSEGRHAAPPVVFLDRLGFLGPGVVGAHGVWVTEDEIAILSARGAAVSHNPESNMKLASGTAPVPGYLEAGVAIGLGTDGAASNNDLDMFEAMRAASLLHKVQTQDPRAASAKTMLEMATIGGARVLGLADRTGALEPGKRADVIVVGMRAARQRPVYHQVSQLVYTTRGDDVRTVIVDGQVLMRDRSVLTLDEAAVLKEADEWAAKVRAAVAR